MSPPSPSVKKKCLDMPSKQHPGGCLTTKWSSKPADHEAKRVRNNQRRHRERVKSHMALLESTLSKTQAELRTALETIEVLRVELDKAHGSPSAHFFGTARYLEDPRMGASCSLTQLVSRTKEPDTWLVERPALTSDDSQAAPMNTEPPRCYSSYRTPQTCTRPQASLHTLQQMAPEDGDSPLLGPFPSTGGATDTDEFIEHEAPSSLQPPAPQESTMRCRDAFKIIEAQNFTNVELSAIRIWLEPGFRKEMAEGDGCRVINKLLFEVIDHINPA